MKVIGLHSLPALIKNQSQVETAAAAASDAAFQSVMASQGLKPNQASYDPAVIQVARDAGAAAHAKAVADATAAGLSTAAGSGAPSPDVVIPSAMPGATSASMASDAPSALSDPIMAAAGALGIPLDDKHKHLVEFGLGIAALALVGLLLRGRAPKLPR